MWYVSFSVAIIHGNIFDTIYKKKTHTLHINCEHVSGALSSSEEW